jgi:hypothetical protein
VKAFVERTPTLAIFGGASSAESSEPNVDALVRSSKNAGSRLVVVPTGHGTEMLEESSELEAAVIDWIAARLGSREGPTTPGRHHVTERTAAMMRGVCYGCSVSLR